MELFINNEARENIIQDKNKLLNSCFIIHKNLLVLCVGEKHVILLELWI